MCSEHVIKRRQSLSPERKALFLAELGRHGVVTEAARVASPGSTSPRGARASFYDERRRDAEFAGAWDVAVDNANGALELEIHRRGVEGYEEHRTDSSGRVTVVRRYSDACLLAMARARLPQFREQDVELSGRVENTSEQDARISRAVEQLATSMAEEAMPGVLAMLKDDLG